jgi:hypothetical protein
LAYLSDVRADSRFAPPPALPVGLLPRMYPRGVRPEALQEALDRHRYPRGKPLPACPICEPDRADPTDPLTQAVAALPTEQRGYWSTWATSALWTVMRPIRQNTWRG